MGEPGDEILDRIRTHLFTAVVGDILDQMGFLNQFLPAEIKPLTPNDRLVGRAMPVVEADYLESTRGAGPFSDKRFGLMLEALDDLRPNEIYVATGSSFTYALLGGIMSTRAKYLGAAGAVLDGYIRDARDIEAIDFPVFSRGVYARDQAARGKVVDYRAPVEIGRVRIEPGDLIFGDMEGVLVVPRNVEREVIDLAVEKAATENKVAEAIRGGMSAREAYDRYGVM